MTMPNPPHPAAIHAAAQIADLNYVSVDDYADIITRHFAPYIGAVEILRGVVETLDLARDYNFDNASQVSERTHTALAAIDKAEKGN